MNARVSVRGLKSHRYRQGLASLWPLESRLLLSVVNEFPLSNTFDPGVITTGPDNQLWYTSFHEEPGPLTQRRTPTPPPPPGFSAKAAIATGPDGNLWLAYSDNAGGEVSKMSTDGTILATYFLGENYTPNAITAGPDGAMWTAGFDFANETTSDGTVVSAFTAEFGRISTSGAVTIYPTGAFDTVGAEHHHRRRMGALWMGVQASRTDYQDAEGNPQTQIGTSEVARLLPGGTVSVYDVGVNNSLITGITGGPGGAIFYTQANNIDPNAFSPQELIGAHHS